MERDILAWEEKENAGEVVADLIAVAKLASRYGAECIIHKENSH